MRQSGVEEGVTHVEAKIGQLLDGGQGKTLEMIFFNTGCSPSKKGLKKGLKQIAEIHRDV